MTPDDLQSRVATLWSFATTVGQPLFIMAGGLLAAGMGVRISLALAGGVMFASAFVLPRAESSRHGAESNEDGPRYRKLAT
ncbi:MAG: hypothetical protein ACRDXX_06310 [Stackebrandtia sp.]